MTRRRLRLLLAKDRPALLHLCVFRNGVDSCWQEAVFPNSAVEEIPHARIGEAYSAVLDREYRALKFLKGRSEPDWSVGSCNRKTHGIDHALECALERRNPGSWIVEE